MEMGDKSKDFREGFISAFLLMLLIWIIFSMASFVYEKYRMEREAFCIKSHPANFGEICDSLGGYFHCQIWLNGGSWWCEGVDHDDIAKIRGDVDYENKTSY